MATKKESELKPRKKTVRKLLRVVLPLLLGLIVLLVLLAPVLISSDKARQIILAKINGAVPGKMDFSDLSVGWLAGVKVADLRFNDNQGRLAVQVGQVSTKPRYGALLMGNLSFGQTVIDKPRIAINLKETGAQKAEAPPSRPPAGPAAKPMVLPIKTLELVLNDGDVKVTDTKSRTVELSQINSKLSLQPPGRQTDFDLRMAVAQAGKPSEIRVASQVTPSQESGWSLKGANGDLSLDINDLDIESLGPLLALAGIDIQAKGIVAGKVKGQIKDGRIEDLNTDVQGKNLDVGGAVLKGDRLQTANLQIHAAVSQGQETIDVKSLQVKTDWASASAGGTVPTTFKSLTDLLAPASKVSLKGDFQCNLAAVAAQMPKTLGIKEGMKVTSGQLSGNVATAAAGGGKQIQATATVSALEGTVEGKKIALSEAIKAEALISSAKAGGQATGMNFDKVSVTAPFAKINCAGNMEALTYNADADLTKLQSELGQFVNFGKYKLAGQFAGKGQVAIKGDKIITTGSSAFNNIVLAAQDGNSVSEPKAQIDTAVDYDKKTSIVAIHSVAASTSFGRLGVKDGVLALNKDSPAPSHLAISANGIDLAKLKPFLVMFASFPKDMQMAGIADSPLMVTAEKNVYKITTDSTTVKGLKLIAPGKKPFEQQNVSVVADAGFNPADKTYSAKLNLSSDQVKGVINISNVNKTNQNAELKGNANLEYDWTAVTTVVAPYLPEGLSLQGKRKDAFNFMSEYPIGKTDQVLPNMTAKAKVGFEKAGYMGLDFGTTDVDIQIDNGLLRIAPFQTVVNEGQFNFAAQGDFKHKPALFTTGKPMQLVKDIKINDQTARQLLRYVSPIFANAVNVSGIANFNCEQLAIPISAQAKKDAVVVGTISISQLQLQSSDLLGQILSVAGGGAAGTVLTLHPTRFELKDGYLRYDDMQIDVGDNPINFKGVIGLDKSLEMTVTLPYTSEGKTVRVGGQTAGRRITLPLKGTVDKPQLDTAKLLELQLKDQGEELLQKGLERIFK